MTLVKISLFLLAGLLSFASAVEFQLLETKFTTEYYLKKYGYECETHKVTTSDKYILTIHRVKCPKTVQNQTEPREVVFLQHGLIASSSNWVLMEGQSLGLILCDLGYDVWMGNVRGNQYSIEHKYLTSYAPAFWAFSWTEMALIDLPTMIEYTLKVTKQDKLTYVGHSQGTTTFFALASSKPDWVASKVKSFHALSPVVFLEHATGVLPILAAPILGLPDPTALNASVPFLPNSYLSSLLGYTVCKIGDVCPELLNLIFGESKLLNTTSLQDMLNTMPAGASLKQIKHYLQMKNSKKFRKFNYSAAVNPLVYRSLHPPSYSLSAIKVPMFLYYAGQDYFASLIDIQRLIDSLNPKAVKGIHAFDDFNHMDFLFSNDVLSTLYSIVIDNFSKV